MLKPAAENLLLRKQLTLYIEWKLRPKRADNATHIALVLLSRLIAWRELLTIVRPDTLVAGTETCIVYSGARNHVPAVDRRFPSGSDASSPTMDRTNRTWGKERIAAELRLKLRFDGLASDGSPIHPP